MISNQSLLLSTIVLNDSTWWQEWFLNSTWWQEWFLEKANVHFQPPESFNFWKPDEWSCWWKHLKQFCIASGLAEEAEDRQVNTLLYCLGNDAEDILCSTNISEEDRKKYGKVLGNFDQFFHVWKNVIIERTWFNSWHHKKVKPLNCISLHCTV